MREISAGTNVQRDSFLTGKQMKFEGRPYNPFVVGARISPGRPDIRPVKATALPLPEKVVPQKFLPFQRVAEKKKRTSIDRRPIALKKDMSVFTQGKQAASLPVRRLEKPKPVTKIERKETGESPVTKKATHERPQPIPKEPVRKTIEQQIRVMRRTCAANKKGARIMFPINSDIIAA